MSRSVEEWIGKTDDEAAPPRVKLRVLQRFCGGENREKNLQPLCEFCEPDKTRADISEKSKTADMAKAAFGLKEPSGRPIPGSRRSRWKHKLGKIGREAWERRA